MEIRPTDVISGALYLKLVNDYKEYDRRQKEIIYDQQQRIKFLEWQVEDMRIEIEESESKSHEKLREKLLRQREALKSYMNVISKLCKEVELLTLKNVQLTMEIQALMKTDTDS
ncbi:MAG: hypothetical protein K2O87_04870 [Duncaniella freteri]|nr:hypothetical protein [Duncaniella freteri]